MSLDRNLFTLNIVPNENDTAVQDLVLPSGIAHYHKQRERGSSYRINLFDPMSQSLLASATAPHASSKHKMIELYNPTQVIEFKSIGTLTFRWSFRWEEHDFEWKREECFLVRKPDPAVLVAIIKDSPGKMRTSTIQILDYNINRFDIADRKGLEITILTTLLTIQDMSAMNHAPSQHIALLPPVKSEAPPSPPPRPTPKTGIDRIAEMHALRYEPNEVTVNEEGSVEDYGEYAECLLADDAMLFITVRSASPADVPKVLQVVEQVKRLRHKREVIAGTSSEELHQYVVYDTQLAGPRRIKLDDPEPNTYTPPSSLTVHLSKISMPELSPRPMAPKDRPVSGPLPKAFPTPSLQSVLPRGSPGSPPLSKQHPASLPHRMRPKTNNTLPALATLLGSPQPRGHSMVSDSGTLPSQQQQAARLGSMWGRARR